ncbi:DUF3320 domain-containing protein [Mycolicibacterium diernhoferi]
MDRHQLIGHTLTTLAAGLSPFVSQVLNRAVPPGTDWAELLRAKDAQNGRGGGEYRSGDVALMLRAMTERLGDLGYPFNRAMPRQAEIYAKELREVRNKWAHTGEFTDTETYRAIDSAELLLRAIGAADVAERVHHLKAAVAPIAAAPAPQPATPAPPRPAPATAPASKPVPPADAPRIDISVIADLSYAMAHCRIPVIDHITVDNTGGDRQGAVLEVDVVSAEGSHGGPAEIHLDLLAHQPTTLQTVDLKLDPASMWRVDEARPGEIRVVLRDSAGHVLAEAAKEVTILAANQWKATPPQLALEVLAAYVQPNAAAIAPLLVEVSDRLGAATGNSSLDGYQSENPERVDAIVRAVFDAVKARDIRYAEPPASWGDIGQKVRTPAEVFDGRLGTCLDTTLTLAAVLEQCGINSTIWLLREHAFLGYWRIDGALASVSTTEPAEVINQVDLKSIGLIETTLVTQSVPDATFDDARRAPRIQHLAEDLTNILGITDVRQARRSRIFPLPSRSTDADGNVVISEYKPGDGPVFQPYEATESKPAATAEAVPARVRQWKNALLDLSLRNKLINYTDRAGYRLEVPGPALGRFEDAVNAGARVNLLGSDEVQNVDVARGMRFGRDLPEAERELLLADKHSAAYIDITAASYKNKLRYLANKAKTIREETGANNLYLAFGMLSWHLNDRPLRSPLVLVPVSLTTTNRGERYLLTIDDTGASTPNYCLIEKLRTALGLEIPGLAQPDEDASGIDLVATFDAVRRAVAEAKLPFLVEDSVHLSILQFAKFPLWKDLDESWKALSGNSLVRHLLESPQNPFVDPVTELPRTDLNELSTAVPVPADASQLRAVADAVGGRTFVLEGPPGTGKSQTITNLLAHAMASGRRVLFVAEKRAALDVVKKRLEGVGLGELSLDIHDKSARPAAVRAQIKHALELRMSHDADLLRTKLQVAESSRHSLARYADRLHEANTVGQSLYTARSFELAADQDIAPLAVPRSLITNADPALFDAVAQVLRTLPEKFDDARPSPEHPWAFMDTIPPSGLDPARIHAAAVAFDTALTELHRFGITADALGRCHSPEAVDGWARLAGEPRYPLSDIDALHTAEWQTYIAGIEQVLAGLQQKPEWLATVTPAAMDLDIPAIHAAAVAADESGMFGRKKRRRAVLAQLTDVLAVDPAEVKLKTLSALTADLQTSHAVVADLRQRVAALPAVLFDRPWNPFVDADAAHLAQALAALRGLGHKLSANPADPHIADLRKFYSDTATGTCAATLQALATSWRQLIEITGSAATQAAWADDASFIGKWWATRGTRRIESAVTIERWVALLQHIDPLLRAEMPEARRDILAGRIVAEDASLAFDRGVAVASVAERLEASGLTDFDVSAHGKAIDRFTTSASAIRDELCRSIPARLLEGRTFDAFTESGQIGLLKRQLDKKRGGMSVRALMENFGELITQILPCTLMSPDSVARFFPAHPDIFDIVVFDEASQIRVADAIGAMGRAKSVVVVGDSKQMPPTSFAETSAGVDDGEEDTNPEVVADEESILSECVQSLVPQQWLSWHYRSQDEALIAFSNIHYYNGRLASFPAPLAPTSGHGISLIRVDGQFERSGRGKTLRTNRVEAERIVADIRGRFDASPHVAPSIGVITFNAQQRDFIENLLRDAGDDRLLQALDEPDGLFVKNLENVQGDERDTILFSVAFSKNDKGVVPLNFGPLSRPGGERRLNVAITRARREVVLYASFDPADLRAEETTQVGTKHLRAYLDLAHRGVDTITQGGRRNAVIDRHRDDIAAALRTEGFAVQADIGLSDFRVDLVIADPQEPDHPLVAVLLDGPEWFGRRTVADRDGLPVEVLSKLLHWPGVERVWLPEWLGDRDATVARLRESVAAAKQRRLEPPAEEVPVPPPVVQPVMEETLAFRSAPAASTPRAPRRHAHLTDFSPWNSVVIGSISVLDEIHTSYNRAHVVKIVESIIDAEGPVHRDRLAKLVAGAFSLGKVSESRKRAIQQVVPAEYSRADDREFYWPNGVHPGTWRTVRTSNRGEGRPIGEISLVEIGNAMRVAAEQTGGSAVDDLKREAMNLLGMTRMGSAVTLRLDQALERALAVGVLRQQPSGIFVVGSA